MSAEGFLSRWSRLKAAPRAEPEMPAEAGSGTACLTPFSAPSPTSSLPLTATVSPAQPGAAPLPQPPPPPTIADAAALTTDSDFSTFVAKNVDAAVRRLAMKKLFSDPHFHGHDGLDIYMGDYSLPSPVSTEMLAEMSHNKNLFASLDRAIEQVDALLAAPVVVDDAVALVPPPDTPEPPPPAPPAPDQEVA